MSLIWCEPPAAVDHERSIICAVRPAVPLPDKLRAREHERDIARERLDRRERVENAAIGAFVLAAAFALAYAVLPLCWGLM